MRPIGAVAVACLLAASGCSFEFDDETTVEDLRVLAVQAEPPEILVDPRQPLVPPTVSLKALVVDPRGDGRPLSVRVLACANISDEAQQFGAPGSGMSTISRDRCQPETSELLADTETTASAATATLTPTLRLLALVQATLMADPISALFGLPLTTDWTIRAGAEEVLVNKRVLLTPRVTALFPDYAGEQAANRNPGAPLMATYRMRGDEKLPLEPDVPVTVAPGAKLFIEPLPADREPYVTIVVDPTTRSAYPKDVEQETMRFAFFASAGTFSPRTTNTEPSLLFTEPEVHVESRYQAPTTPPPDGLVTIWVVVRDERGGAAWTTRTLRIE